MYIYVYIYIHTYIYTHTHIHIHIHKYSLNILPLLKSRKKFSIFAYLFVCKTKHTSISKFCSQTAFLSPKTI